MPRTIVATLGLLLAFGLAAQAQDALTGELELTGRSSTLRGTAATSRVTRGVSVEID